MSEPVTKRSVSRLAAMPGRPQLSLLACLLAVALGGCGSDEEGTIPESNSNDLLTLLDGIEQSVAGGNCDVAQKQADEFVDAVNQLPAEVDDEVKGGIQEAAAQLRELSNEPSQCEDTTGPTDFENLEPTTTTPTTTEPPTTTETKDTTTTTTTEPEEEEQAPPEEEPPSENGGGPPSGAPPAGTPPGQGEVEIEPPSEDEPTSGGIGGEKGPRR
jgi:hypothetical protein